MCAFNFDAVARILTGWVFFNCSAPGNLSPSPLGPVFVYKPRTGNQTALGRFKLVNKTCPVQKKMSTGNLVWQSGLWEHSPFALTAGQNIPREVWLHWTRLTY